MTPPAPPTSGVPGPETGEPAAGSGGPSQDHRLRVRQADHGPDVDPVRHPRVPRQEESNPGGHSGHFCHLKFLSSVGNFSPAMGARNPIGIGCRTGPLPM